MLSVHEINGLTSAGDIDTPGRVNTKSFSGILPSDTTAAIVELKITNR